MKANKFGWWFRLITTILIPVSFFVIASAEGAAYWLAGVMTIIVLFYYVLIWQKIGDEKSKNE